MSAVFLAFLACAPDPAPSQAEPTLPDVWGIDALPDLDPAAGIVQVELRASETEMSWLDGETTEDVWAYNGQVPGPLIQAWLGDTIQVRFTNDLPEETTIHWHGLRISDEMDGVPAIQEPVQPGESFTYEFTPPDSGTFWYHPHVRSHEQIERGLQGVLIVHEPDAPKVSADRMFVLDDALLLDNGNFSRFTISHMESVHGRYGNTLLANGQNILAEQGPLSAASESGTVERWRLVNTANARPMWARVTGARWRVIAIDGTLLPAPYEADEVELPIGRRVDVEVLVGDEAPGLSVLIPSGRRFDEFTAFMAEVQGSEAAPEWSSWPAAGLPAPPSSFDQEVSLRFSVRADGNLAVWTINGETWGEHSPVYVDGGVPTTISIQETSGAEHPFHLHGQFFQVLERDGEPVHEPGLMDTVTVGADEELLLWTDFSNPGRWMNHCHILEHSEQGMMAEIIVSEP